MNSKEEIVSKNEFHALKYEHTGIMKTIKFEKTALQETLRSDASKRGVSMRISTRRCY